MLKEVSFTRRKKMTLIIAAVFLGCFAIIFAVGVNSFLKKKADTNDASNTITLSGTITYKDGSGNSVSEQGKSNIIRASSLTVNATLKGRDISTSKPVFTFNFVDPTTNQDSGSATASLNQNNESLIDWTSLSNLDPSKIIDLRISSPGFLSRRITDISLLGISGAVQSSPLIAGDVNQDHKINWEDYFSWKSKYGQTVSNDPGDFNGDGVVDYKDYALSFGTRCYNATESNQDDQCKQ